LSETTQQKIPENEQKISCDLDLLSISCCRKAGSTGSVTDVCYITQVDTELLGGFRYSSVGEILGRIKGGKVTDPINSIR
jgi:hypothetical protein